MKNNKIFVIGAALGLLFLLTKEEKINKRDYLKQITSGENTDAFDRMTDTEINYVYSYFINYVNKGLKILPNDPLYAQIKAISIKYNVFT